MARETTRFILFTTIAAGLSTPEVRPLGMTLLFLLGGTWTLGLSLLLHAVFGQAKRAAEPSAAATRTPARPVALLLRRWRESNLPLVRLAISDANLVVSDGCRGHC